MTQWNKLWFDCVSLDGKHQRWTELAAIKTIHQQQQFQRNLRMERRRKNFSIRIECDKEAKSFCSTRRATQMSNQTKQSTGVRETWMNEEKAPSNLLGLWRSSFRFFSNCKLQQYPLTKIFFRNILPLLFYPTLSLSLSLSPLFFLPALHSSAPFIRSNSCFGSVQIGFSIPVDFGFRFCI